MGRPKRASDIVTSDHFSKKNKIVTSHYIGTKRNKRRYTEALAQDRAEYLAKELNNPSRFMFYLKCAWNLTDAYLDRLLDISLQKTDAKRYFSAAAAREMKRNG